VITDDLIRKLCFRAVLTEDPVEFKIALNELKIAISESIRDAENKGLQLLLKPKRTARENGNSE